MVEMTDMVPNVRFPCTIKPERKLNALLAVFQTHNALMTPRRMLRQLQDDEAKMLGYAIGVSSKDTDDPLSEEDQGHRIGILARAAIDSFRR